MTEKPAPCERILVEAYFPDYPDLQGDTEVLLDLLYGEVLLREEIGDKPGLAGVGLRGFGTLPPWGGRLLIAPSYPLRE